MGDFGSLLGVAALLTGELTSDPDQANLMKVEITFGVAAAPDLNRLHGTMFEIAKEMVSRGITLPGYLMSGNALENTI